MKSSAATDVREEKTHISGLTLQSERQIQGVRDISAVRGKTRGLGGSSSRSGGPSSDPSLDEVATPWRDVGAVVGVEKPLQFFIVPLK